MILYRSVILLKHKRHIASCFANDQCLLFSVTDLINKANIFTTQKQTRTEFLQCSNTVQSKYESLEYQ